MVLRRADRAANPVGVEVITPFDRVEFAGFEVFFDQPIIRVALDGAGRVEVGSGNFAGADEERGTVVLDQPDDDREARAVRVGDEARVKGARRRVETNREKPVGARDARRDVRRRRNRFVVKDDAVERVGENG